MKEHEFLGHGEKNEKILFKPQIVGAFFSITQNLK